MHEPARQIGSQIGEPLAPFSSVCLGDSLERRTRDGPIPGHEMEQQHTHAVDVARNCGDGTVKELRGEIERGARGTPARRPVSAHFACAEIHQHDAAARLAHHVLRLDVTMNEARFMNRRDGAAQVDPDERCLARPEHSACRQHSGEREPVDELHPQPDNAVVLIHSINRDDVRVPHARKQTRFPDDFRRAAGVAEKLHGDIALQHGIPCEIDGGKVAAADLVSELQRAPARHTILADLGSGCE